MLNTEPQQLRRSEALRWYQSHTLTLIINVQTNAAKADRIEMTYQILVKSKKFVTESYA